MSKKYNPTDSELEILQILWSKGHASVREVHDILREKKDVGYTTTLKIMQIMHEKNIVTRDTSSRSHIYKANTAKEDTQKSLLQNFITNTFKGSTKQLVLQALGNAAPNQQELDEIKDLIAKLENK